jgi:hypothetical protein
MEVGEIVTTLIWEELGKVVPKVPTIYDLLNETDWSIEDVLRDSARHVQGSNGPDLSHSGDPGGTRR